MMRQFKVSKKITNRDGYAMEKYFSEIAGVGLLSGDEEVELSQRARQGDQDALDQMVKANLRFVISVAKQYQGQGLALSDLINEGNLGLIKGAMRFDPTRGFRFISYAVWWIRQSILQALSEHARIVRLPSNKIGVLNKLNKAIAQLEQEFEREPTPDELAEILHIKSDDVPLYMHSANKAVSMDDQAGENEDSSTVLELMEDKGSPTPENRLLEESLKKEVRRLLNVLTPKESAVISYFFGLNGNSHLSYEEIGDRIGLSRERVRQLKDKGLRKLKKTRYNRILRVYLGS